MFAQHVEKSLFNLTKKKTSCQHTRQQVPARVHLMQHFLHLDLLVRLELSTVVSGAVATNAVVLTVLEQF